METAEIILPVARENLRRLTVDDYHQMGEAAVFGSEERVELLNGEIFTISPIGPYCRLAQQVFQPPRWESMADAGPKFGAAVERNGTRA